MDGLEAVEINLSELENLRTIGAEFYAKIYVNAVNIQKKSIENLKELVHCCKVITDGDHGAPKYKDKGVFYILSESVKSGYIDKNIFRFISEKLHKNLKRSELLPRNVVVTKTGIYFGKSAVIPDGFPVANTSAHVGKLEVNEEIVNPYYLSTFLNCKYGYLQLRRRGVKATRPEIKLIEFNDIKISIPSIEVQQKIESVIKLSQQKLEESKKLYKEAEELLLQDLDLLDFTPTEKNVSEKTFSESFGTSGRLDSEYYQLKYDQLDHKIARFKKIKLKELVNYPISSGSTPKAGGDDYTTKGNGGIPFIRAVNIINSKVEFDDVIYVKDYIHNKKLKKTKLKENDVLFSIAGTVGRCGLSTYKEEANINQAVAILRFNEAEIKRFYLILFFNSFVGKMYISKFSRQGLQTNLNLDEVGELEIPLIDFSLQETIESKIKESFKLKEESKNLLELAKRSVEIAIEEDEERALKYIEENR